MNRKKKLSDIILEIIQKSFLPFAVFSPDWSLIICTDEFTKLTGYSENELRQMNMSDTLTARNSQDIEQTAIARLKETKMPVNYKKEIIHREGYNIPVQVCCNLVCDGESIKYFYQLIIDIESTEVSQKLYKTFVSKNQNKKNAVSIPDTEFIYGLSHGSLYSRLKAVVSLGKTSDTKAVSPLIQCLGDLSKDIRMNAALSLGEIGDKKAVPHLIESLLKDGSSNVRWGAAIALGRISHDEHITEALKNALNDKDVDVRNAARQSLSQTKFIVR